MWGSWPRWSWSHPSSCSCSASFGFGFEMGFGFGGDGADEEGGRGVGNKAGHPGFHVVGDVEEEPRAGQAHHVGGRGGVGMGLGAGRQERDDFGEVAGDGAGEIDDGEEGGDDDGLFGLFGAARGRRPGGRRDSPMERIRNMAAG